MPGFRWTGNGTRYVVARPFSWEIGRKGSGVVITVPQGFEFDVSIPRYLWPILDPHDHRYFKAAAMHDMLLEDGWNRVAAAAPFSEALRAQRLGALHRLAMVFAVIGHNWR